MCPLFVPIVEGHAEVSSVPIILRRLCWQSGIYDIQIDKPVRVHRNRIIKPDEVERAVNLALLRGTEVNGILLVLDSDDDCPKELAPKLYDRMETAVRGYRACSVVFPVRELEAWYCGSIVSLRGRRGVRSDALPPPDPEIIRDAKGWLSDVMEGHSYVSTVDQPAFADLFSLIEAEATCPSFGKLRRDLDRLLLAART